MSRVRVICRNYQGDYQGLNGSHDIDVNYRRFLTASLTLGFQRFQHLRQAGPRIWMHRLGLGISAAAFLEDQNGQLCLSSDHGALDASEKGAASYWQGMVFAKLAAAEIMGIRWLQHADAMERDGQLQRQTGVTMNKRADMAGRDDDGSWHVVEAKGFSSHPGLPAFANAKSQAAMVARVNNVPPKTTSACVTSLWKTPIEVLMDDPPPVFKESWFIVDDDYWRQYYRGLINYIKDMREIVGRRYEGFAGFTFAPLYPIVGIARFSTPPWNEPLIGLPNEILNDPRLAPSVVSRLFAEDASVAGPVYDSAEYVSEDGVALIGDVGSWFQLSR